MRAILQRVKEASVTTNTGLTGKINQGLLILLGIEEDDKKEDIDWLCRKIVNMRIFSDEEEKMNHSVKDVHGELLVVSQFTLFASTKKGNRPSFIRSAKPAVAIPLYEQFLSVLERQTEHPVQTGEFGAMMDVQLVNDGPVTIFIDTKNKE